MVLYIDRDLQNICWYLMRADMICYTDYNGEMSINEYLF